jgi:hypothetical protein
MATAIEEFPHGGEHLENDEAQARITLWLLAAFTILATFVLIATFA